MIVVCSTCQARFKVADEKIGPRGAKVRCSKCQTVFMVHRDLGVMPAVSQPAEPAPPAPPTSAGGVDLDLEGTSGAGVRPNGFVADPFGRNTGASNPFGSADPFQQPAAAPQPAPRADPFAAPDPFADSEGSGGFGAIDPFVATVASPSPGLPTSAVTDLSDLLGDVAPHESQPEPSGILDTGFDFDTSAAAQPQLDVQPQPAPQSPPREAGGVGADLALDERTPSPGHAIAPMPGFGDFAGVDPFDEQGPASAQGGQAAEEAVDFDAFGGAAEAAKRQPVPSATPFDTPASAGATAADAEPRPVDAVETTDEGAARTGAFRGPSRVRQVAVNAISLAALLAVALGFLTVWRGVRPGAYGFLRPSALLGAVGEETEPFTVSQLRSGVYERPDAAPLIFVSGAAVSHAAGSVAGVRVKVEVVRRGEVLARGEARAGAIPTPEELCASRDAAGLASELTRIGSRAPSSVKPGDSVPFVVAIADYPSDVTGAGLLVALEPTDAPTPQEGAKKP